MPSPRSSPTRPGGRGDLRVVDAEVGLRAGVVGRRRHGLVPDQVVEADPAGDARVPGAVAAHARGHHLAVEDRGPRGRRRGLAHQLGDQLARGLGVEGAEQAGQITVARGLAQQTGEGSAVELPEKVAHGPSVGGLAQQVRGAARVEGVDEPTELTLAEVADQGPDAVAVELAHEVADAAGHRPLTQQLAGQVLQVVGAEPLGEPAEDAAQAAVSEGTELVEEPAGRAEHLTEAAEAAIAEPEVVEAEIAQATEAHVVEPETAEPEIVEAEAAGDAAEVEAAAPEDAGDVVETQVADDAAERPAEPVGQAAERALADAAQQAVADRPEVEALREPAEEVDVTEAGEPVGDATEVEAPQGVAEAAEDPAPAAGEGLDDAPEVASGHGVDDAAEPAEHTAVATAAEQATHDVAEGIVPTEQTTGERTQIGRGEAAQRRPRCRR